MQPANKPYGEAATNKLIGLADIVEAKPRALMVTEVAALLNVSGRQIYKLVAEHRIPYLRIAGCIRFDPYALAAWLREKAAHFDPAPLSCGEWKNDATGWSFEQEARNE
jgi:excisionase family DNA binding protein